jgi:hypothetical protein
LQFQKIGRRNFDRDRSWKTATTVDVCKLHVQ